jgi:hypothetical protein
VPKKNETALAKSESLTILVAIDQTALDTALESATAEAEGLDEILVEDQESLELILGRTSELCRILDAFEAERKLVVEPINAKKNEVQGRYNPVKEALGYLISEYKAKGNAYLLEQDAKRRALESAAAKAARAGDTPALKTAIVASQAAAPVKVAGASTQFEWKVKRYVLDLLQDEFWCPDAVKIQDEAERQGVKGDEPPVIAGVVFERVASTAVRR